MSALRQDLFLEQIKSLKREYPEYANILDFLIEKLEQGKHEKIQQKLKQLRNHNW